MIDDLEKIDEAAAHDRDELASDTLHWQESMTDLNLARRSTRVAGLGKIQTRWTRLE